MEQVSPTKNGEKSESSIMVEMDGSKQKTIYESMTKDQLVSELLKRDVHSAIDTRIQKKKIAPTPENNNGKVNTIKQGKNKKRNKEFDFSNTRCRPVAFLLTYFGWDYYGYTSQRLDTVETIEKHLFRALETAKFIPSREQCRYSRCGRTDKGVSSFGQVVSLFIRTSLPLGVQGTTTWDKLSEMPNPLIDRNEFGSPDTPNIELINIERMKEFNLIPEGEKDEQLTYLDTINRLLPDDIILEGWTPVPPTFNARFHCHWRRYKYFFQEDNLDIEAMQKAARKLIGRHDFRFFCKVDPTKSEESYTRQVLESAIIPLVGTSTENSDFKCDELELEGLAGNTQYTDESQDPVLTKTKFFMSKYGGSPGRNWVFCIKGHAFLWHQVRCMMAILRMVGEGKEDPEIVDWLFKTDKETGRPTYDMAAELPLVLVECGYVPGLLDWRRDSEVRIAGSKKGIPASLRTLVKLHKGLEFKKRIQFLQMDSFVGDMQRNSGKTPGDINMYTVTTGGAVTLEDPEKYRPLHMRDRCDSVKSKVQRHELRQEKRRKTAETPSIAPK